MKAKKLPSGSWNVQVFVGLDQNGKKIRKSFTAPTKKEAEYLAASFKAHHQEVTRDSSAMTLTEAIDKYIEFKGATLSPSTVRGYRIIQRSAFPDIMSVKLNKITAAKLQASINAFVLKKKPKTLKNELGLVKSVIKQYAPSVNINNVTLPQNEKFTAQELTLSQVITLMNAAINDSEAVPLLLGLCCGLRMSEILALSHSNFNISTNSIVIEKARVKNENNVLVEKTTKTVESLRFITIPTFLAKKISELPKDSRYLITSNPNTIRKHLKKLCTENDIPAVRFHDLRHINASVMLYLNIPSKYAMERGGWSDIKTMDKIYQFTFKDQKKIVDDRINDFFSQAIDL